MINRKYFENMLERCYPQEGLSKVPAKSIDLRSQTNGQWEPITLILRDWERQGIVNIIKNPEDCEPNEICIKFNKFFSGKRFPLNWIRD